MESKEGYMVNLEEIQRSLLWDLKQNLAACGFTGLNRRAYDDLYKLIVGRPLEAVKLYKELNQELCTQFSPHLRYPGHDIALSRDWRVVFAFRQALGLFSRLHACVTEQVRQTQLREAALRVAEAPICLVRGRALEYMREFVERVIGPMPPAVDTWPCHHGPGAVAEGKMERKHIFASVKGQIARYVDRQAFVYDKRRIDEDGTVFHKYVCPDFTRLFCLPNQPDPFMKRVPDEELATRVVTVPKDAQKVRIISCEPASSQFVQEGLKDILYKRMSRIPQLDPESQERNQVLALQASSGLIQCDTLDMSNASDNVRLEHVLRVFPYDWIQALIALRSPNMKFPEGNVQITSYAPMGSALCFPVEMLVFGAIVYASYRLAGLSNDFHEFVSDDSWGVFGDDTVTKHAATKYILALLRGMGIPCNVSKSCIGDVPFKEACGVDAFLGHCITVVRPRMLSSSRVAAAPMVQHANRLFALGFVRTAQALANLVRVPVSLGHGPHLAEPGLQWPRLGRVRYNKSLQRFEGEVPFNRLRKPEASQGWEALYLWFTDSRQSSHPFYRKNENNCIPTTIWAPMLGREAFAQCAKSCNRDARARKGPIVSPGSKPRAQGTPVGESPVERSCSGQVSTLPVVDAEFELQVLREYYYVAETLLNSGRTKP